VGTVLQESVIACDKVAVEHDELLRFSIQDSVHDDSRVIILDLTPI
jgi:hypothetical protein